MCCTSAYASVVHTEELKRFLLLPSWLCLLHQLGDSTDPDPSHSRYRCVPFGGLDQPTTGPTIPVTYYSVLLDGTPTTNYNNSSASPPDYTNSVLASFSNLTFGQHTIELVLNNPQDISNGSIQLHFDRAVITSGVPTAFWDEQNPG